MRQLLWRDNRYRGAFAAPAPSIARVRLGPMLASLRGALGALKPEHLLPDAHFDPPGTVVVVSRDDAPRASTSVTGQTLLKANPLVAVLRYTDVPRDSDGEEWEAVDGDNGTAGGASLAGSVSGDDSRRGSRRMVRSAGGGSDSDSGEAATNGGSVVDSEAPAGGPESLLPGHQGYVVHLNYGNERLESHMRTEIQVSVQEAWRDARSRGLALIWVPAAPLASVMVASWTGARRSVPDHGVAAEPRLVSP